MKVCVITISVFTTQLMLPCLNFMCVLVGLLQYPRRIAVYGRYSQDKIRRMRDVSINKIIK